MEFDGFQNRNIRIDSRLPDIIASYFNINVPSVLEKDIRLLKSIINGYFDCLNRSLNTDLDAQKDEFK